MLSNIISIQKLSAYANTAGECFDIELFEFPVHSAPNSSIWAFDIIVTHRKWGQMNFYVMMAKSTFSSMESAHLGWTVVNFG